MIKIKDAPIDGITLGLDIGTVKSNKLEDLHLLKHLIIDLAHLLELKPIQASIKFYFLPVTNCDGHGTGELGVTGLMALRESHITIHTWPEYQYCRIEISSCKGIDKEQREEIKKLLIKRLGVSYRAIVDSALYWPAVN